VSKKGVFMRYHKRIYPCVALLALSISGFAGAAELQWVGCEVSKAAYVSDLANGFQQKTGNLIHINVSDSNDGIRGVLRGDADLGSSTRYLLPDDPREAGVEIVPVAWDALTVIVHGDNPLKDISLEQLRQIYSGKISNWSVLGGADQKIQVYIHHYGNTTAGSNLRELIFSDQRQKFTIGRLVKADDSIDSLVMDDPNAIAITGISNARSQAVKILSLDGIAPSTGTIKSGEYKLYRPLYLTYNPDSENLDTIKNFISYMNSKPARELMRANGVVPYTEAMGLVMRKVRKNQVTYPQAVEKL
jgi:phosphate transport system substrate-binding protein